MKQLKQPDNKIMIYPIYHHQSVLNDICDTLGYDINTIINKDFNHSTKVYTYKSQDNLTNLLQLSVLSFFRI